MNFPFVGDVKVDEKGDLVLDMRDRSRIKEYVNETFKDGDKVWVTLSLPTKERTHKQFKYLHAGVYDPIAKELGCNMETVDGVMRKRFLTVNRDTPLEYTRNKTDLTRKELAEYTNDVSNYGRDMGIEILEPVGETEDGSK